MPKRFLPLLIPLIAAALAVGDWFGLLGSTLEQHSDIAHLTIRAVDLHTRKPIADVHLSCARISRRQACTERTGATIGDTRLTIAVLRTVERGLLFTHDRGITLGAAGELLVNTIHPNYARRTFAITVDDVVRAAEARVVELEPSAN